MTSSLSSTCAKVRSILPQILAFTLISSTSFGQELPVDFVTRNVASGAKFELPVGIAFAPDERIFVAEKNGKVYVIDNGRKISEPFIDLESEVLSKHDQGLLGIAVDPNFEENRWVYLLYVVDPTGGRDDDRQAFSRLTRYKARSENLNQADKNSRQVLMGKDWRDGFIACSDQHLIGSLRFALDGTLLVSAGEAGEPGIPDAGGTRPGCFGGDRFDQVEDIGSFRSQYLGSLAGKILRIDPETGLGLSSNPYYTGQADDIQSRVWAYGLRNPFRFSVRPNGSLDADEGRPGSVYIGDVGWNQYEDLNVSRAGGENFGWPCYEGPEAVQQYRRKSPAHSGCDTIGSPDNPASHSLPLVYWHHTDPNKSQPNGLIGSAVTGGAFYLGNSYPAEYRGGYFFADFVEGWMKVLKVDEQDNLIEILDFATLPGGLFEHGIVDIQSHPDNGDIHYVDITAGEIVRMIYTAQAENQEPIAIAEADTMWGHAALSVQFVGSESYDPDGEDLTYLWQFGTGDTSVVPDPVYIYANNGEYSVRLRVTDPQGASSSFILKITVGSLPPLVAILSPEEGVSVFTDERIFLEGEAVDPDEPETNLRYEWAVDVHHNTHLHPSSLLLEGKVVSLVPGNHGDPWDIIYLEAKLKVTDSSGLTSTKKRYVVLKIRGEKDITDQGSPIVLVTDPTGSGNKDIEVIRDGVFPVKGSRDVAQHYDTFRPDEGRVEDWIGYEFSESHRLSKVIFQEGIQFADGGWFETLSVQIRQAGVWKDGFFFNSIPQYPGGNRVNYETYTLLFTPENGDAIRIKGLPGGSSRYISVAELRVIETQFQPPPVPRLVLAPTDDARIRSSKPDFNYGTSTEIRVREASGVQRAYLKFSVVGLAGTILSAKLRLYTNDGGPDGGALYQVSNNLLNSNTPWDEVQLNFFNAPAIDGAPLGTAGPVAAGNWVEFDVGAVVLGNGVYSFGLKNASADMVEYSSKEGAQAPELVIEREVVETFPPEIVSFDPQSGVVGSEVTILGDNFSGYTDVLFGGVSATAVTLDSEDQIRAQVPEGAFSGRVSVLSPTGTTVSATDFSVVADDTTGSHLTPHIVSFTPDRATVGTEVEIRGSHFAQTTAVSFGDMPATFTIEADSVLRATVPNNAASGKISVRTEAGTAISGDDFIVDQPTSVAGFKDGFMPHELVLNFSYPNPFNLETAVEYGLPKLMQVRIEVYNLRGQAVRRLVDATESAGFRTISWDGRDELGRIVSSGIYFIRLRTDSRILSKKITLQK